MHPSSFKDRTKLLHYQLDSPYNLGLLLNRRPVTCFPMFSPHTSYANSVDIPGGLGFVLIGGLLSTMFYGITILQTYV